MPLFELKRQARLDMRETRPRVFWTALIYFGLLTAISLLASRLSGYTAYMENVNSLLDRIQKLGPKTMEEIIALLPEDMSSLYPSVSRFSAGMSGILVLLYAMLQAGFSGYCLLVSRRAPNNAKDLMLSFEHPLKVLIILFLTALLIALWSLLFIIPGVIAAFRYSQAILIHFDHPDYPVIRCLRESRLRMKGKKMTLFLLVLSFILWAFLDQVIIAIIGVPVLKLFLAPYYGITMAHFYNSLPEME